MKRLRSTVLSLAAALASSACTEKIPLPEPIVGADAGPALDAAVSVDVVKVGADAFVSPDLRVGGFDGLRGDALEGRCVMSRPLSVTMSKPPKVVFAVDHSVSMYAQNGFGSEGKTRIGAVKAKLLELLVQAPDRMEPSLSQFPSIRSDAACDKSAPTCCATRPAPMRIDNISDKGRCEGEAVCAESPADVALNQAQVYLDTLGNFDPYHGDLWTVLVTDGEPIGEGISRCHLADTVVGQMRAKKIKVAVVAIGDAAKSAPCLPMLATHPSLYYAAPTPGELDKHFETLRDLLTADACEISPSRPGSSFQDKVIEVNVGGEIVPRVSGHSGQDHGWDFTSDGRIRLGEDVCAKVVRQNRPLQVRECGSP